MISSEACCLVPRPLYRPHARRNVLGRSIGYMGRKFRRQNGQEWPILTPSGAAARRSAGLNWESPWGHFRPRVRPQIPPGCVGPEIRRQAVAKQAPSCSTYSVCTSSSNISECFAKQKDSKKALGTGAPVWQLSGAPIAPACTSFASVRSSGLLRSRLGPIRHPV